MRSFSPLFIGCESETGAWSRTTLPLVSFSPLFIGCESETYKLLIFAMSLSAFSPLFIGCESETPKVGPVRVTSARIFQSPFHRV